MSKVIGITKQTKIPDRRTLLRAYISEGKHKDKQGMRQPKVNNRSANNSKI